MYEGSRWSTTEARGMYRQRYRQLDATRHPVQKTEWLPRKRQLHFPPTGSAQQSLPTETDLLSQQVLWAEKSADLYRINNPNTWGPRPSRSLWTTKHFGWQIDNFIVDASALTTLQNFIRKVSDWPEDWLASSSMRLLAASCPITRWSPSII